MAIRVDNQGYLLKADGTRYEDKRNDKALAQERWDKVVRDWKTSHPDDTDGLPDDGTTIMFVERGDCQWTIAKGAGADPAKTAYSLNG